MGYMLADIPVGEFPDDPPGVEDYYVTPTTEVPLLIGLLREEAEDEIYDAHLSPNVVEVNSIEELGVVLTQDLEEGTEATHGQALTIEVSSGVPPEAPLINLLTMSVDEAVIALNAFEEETGIALEFSVNFQTVTDRNLVGRIIQTINRAPGIGVGRRASRC